MKIPFIHRFFSKPKASSSPSSDFWYKAVGALSAAGVAVTPENAIKLSAIWACNKVISETVGLLPFITYEQLKGGGKDRAPNHHLYHLLKDAPNDIQTAVEWREAMQTFLNLYGNAYSVPGRGFGGEVVSLGIPIHPSRVKVELVNGNVLRYTVNHNTGQDAVYLGDEMLHLKGITTDGGLVGLSPIEAGVDSLGLARAAELFGSSFYKGKARPAGIVKLQSQLTNDAKSSLRESIQAQGESGILVLDEGMEWEMMQVEPESAQFIETRTFQLDEVCRWYRMPPHKIQNLVHATFSNIEHQSLEFLSDTILPQVRKWEQKINHVLFPDHTFFAEMLTEVLLRADLKSRTESITKMISWALMTPNEGRALLNMNPYEGGERFYRPLNFAVVGEDSPEQLKGANTVSVPAAKELPAPEVEQVTEDIQAIVTSNRIRDIEQATAFENETIDNQVIDIATRLSNAEKRGLENCRTEKKIKSFQRRHHTYIIKALEPLNIKIEPEILTTKNCDDITYLKQHIIGTLNGALKR